MRTKKKKSHDQTLREVFGVTQDTVVARILRTFDRATPSDIEAGVAWYGEAGRLAASLSAQSGRSEETCAQVISALSPRTTWTRNVQGATSMLTGAPMPVGLIGRNIEDAQRVLDGGPLTGPKRLAFAANILGDVEAVTVDVWALRVAQLEETGLGRVGAYEAVAHAYRLAARRRGVSPATMQATTWVVARNGRAS